MSELDTRANGGFFERLAGSTLALFTGLIADLAAVVALLSSDTVLTWLSSNPTISVIALACLLAVAILSTNQLSRSRRSERTLIVELANANLALSNASNDIEAQAVARDAEEGRRQDRARYTEFVEDFGKDSVLYRWLNGMFVVTTTRYENLREVDRLDHKWSQDPLEYNAPEVEVAFSRLKAELSTLSDVTSHHYFAVEGNLDYYTIETGSRLVEDSKYLAAVRDVEEAGNRVAERWNVFVRSAHLARLD